MERGSSSVVLTIQGQRLYGALIKTVKLQPGSDPLQRSLEKLHDATNLSLPVICHTESIFDHLIHLAASANVCAEFAGN